MMAPLALCALNLDFLAKSLVDLEIMTNGSHCDSTVSYYARFHEFLEYLP